MQKFKNTGREGDRERRKAVEKEERLKIPK